MRRTRVVKCVALFFSVVLFFSTVWATTWADREFVCPVCKTKNTFGVVASYGSYIYQWPSKYQFIYWPLTDEHVVYSCKNCYLSLLMWDYDKLPPEKIPAIKDALKGTRIEGDYKRYTAIPMSVRLDIAEKVYAQLDKDDEFWCEFYRVKGYHYSVENNQPKADEARKKALELATRQLSGKPGTVPVKELWLISGAMKHFLGDDKGAVGDLNTALKTKYENKKLDKEQNRNGENNLSALAKEYIGKIQGPQKPRLMKE